MSTNMFCLSQLVLLLLGINICLSTPRLYSENGAILFVNNGVIHKINENITLNFLGYDFSSLDVASKSELLNLTKGDDVPSMEPIDNSPDDVMRRHLLKFYLLQGSKDLLRNLTFIMNGGNPSIAYWRGHHIMALTISDPRISVCILDDSFNIDKSNSYFGIGPGCAQIGDLRGEDPRLLVVNSSEFVMAFTHPNDNNYQKFRMEMAHVTFNETSQSVSPGSGYLLHPEKFMDNHKNWSPFLYEGKVLFIETLHPLTCIEYSTDPDNAQIRLTKTISTSPVVNIPWSYGTMRGGTPPLLVGGHYLSFFHSRIVLPGNGFHTYFMGAYTFTTSMPFTINSISRVPIAHDRFYTGPWSGKKGLDYIVFPMAFIVQGPKARSEDVRGPKGDILPDCLDPECLQQHDVILSLGVQDNQCWTVRINLFELIDSMDPVTVADAG